MFRWKGSFIGVLLLCSEGIANMEENLISSQEVPLYQNICLEGWLDNYGEAKRIAQIENKPILIAFLGPQWCHFSDQLEREILINKNFLDSLNKDVILLKVDIPQDFNEKNTEQLPALQLKNAYRIEECPSLVLIDQQGIEIAKLQYLPLEGKEFASYIQEILKDFQKMYTLVEKSQLNQLSTEELKSLYRTSEKLSDHAFKKALLKQGLKTDKGAYFLLEQYGNLLASDHFKQKSLRKIRSKIEGRDPKNLQGAQRQLALLDFENLLSIKTPQKASTVIQPLLLYLKRFGIQDAENAWQLEMKISQYLFSRDLVKEALEHAQLSLAKAPEARQKEIKQSIEYLQAHIQ